MLNENKTSHTLDELKNFKTDFSHDEIIENLKNDNISDFVKIFSIINLSDFKTSNEALIFINHLTNHPTPIREAVSIKFEELGSKYFDFFQNDFSKEKILNAITDINPNVSRALCTLFQKEKRYSYLEPYIIEKIECLLREIEADKDSQDDFYNKTTKSHAKNKKLFSLYWFLEALSILLTQKYNSKVLKIIESGIKFKDYTIREKAAKILVKIENPPIELLNFTKYDQNFYVKNQVYVKINFED